MFSHLGYHLIESQYHYRKLCKLNLGKRIHKLEKKSLTFFSKLYLKFSRKIRVTNVDYVQNRLSFVMTTLFLHNCSRWKE